MRRFWLVPCSTLFAAAVVSVGACGEDEPSSNGAGVTCAPTDAACPAVGVGTECLGLVDNRGEDRFALRLAQLAVEAPTALTTPLVAGIVGDGVYINLDRDACNVSGMGTFNFIVEFDKTAGTLELGGAFPEQDPTNGYCYVNDPANEVAPITINSNLQADGSFSTDPIEKIVVPIFVDQTAEQVVYLPLREGRIQGAQLSADQNCIGRFNADGLEPRFNCAPSPEEGINYFVDAGTLTGYVTLEEADAVTVDLLNQSLCVLLSGDADAFGDGGEPERCARDGDGNILLQGDWCSETNSAGGCQDAFELRATVSASSVALRDDCPDDPPGTGGGGTGGGGGAGGAGGGT